MKVGTLASSPSNCDHVFVDLQEAIQRVNQILDEEQAHPTTHYVLADKSNALQLAFTLSLSGERETRPRRVCENPQAYTFTSVNYQLLTVLFSQIDSKLHSGLFGTILSRITRPNSYRKASNLTFPNWYLYVSEHPLIAEFCVRSGEKQNLFRAIGESQLTLGLLLLLMQFEEMLSFNFNLLPEQELQQLSAAVSNLRPTPEERFK